MDSSYGSIMPALVLILLFLPAQAVMSGFGAAVQRTGDAEIDQYPADERTKERLKAIMDRPGAFIECSQLLTMLGGSLAGVLFLMVFFRHLLRGGTADARQAAAGAAAYILFLLAALVFGISLPKRLAERNSVSWAFRCLLPVRVIMALLLPVRIPVLLVAWPVFKLFGIDPEKQEENVTEEDIMSMVTEGHEQGVVEADEAEMITNIFQLNDKQASDVMVHRKNIIGIEAGTHLSDAVNFILKEGHNSRYPVYRGNIDNCLGVLHMKDALIRWYEGRFKEMKISDIPGLLRPALFIPETRALDNLFKEMQARKIHMVFVVDEYGQTAGIVTMEDILEEIVGNIVDEYDREEELFKPLSDGAFFMRGTIPLSEAEEAAGIPFTDEEKDEFDTLNGFLIAKLDRIPADGEKLTVEAHGFRFRILHTQNKVIRSVRVKKIPEEETAEKDGADRKKPGAKAEGGGEEKDAQG